MAPSMATPLFKVHNNDASAHVDLNASLFELIRAGVFISHFHISDTRQARPAAQVTPLKKAFCLFMPITSLANCHQAFAG